jgi:hypothetical protein
MRGSLRRQSNNRVASKGLVAQLSFTQKATKDTKTEWLNRRKGRLRPELSRTATEVKKTCSRWQGIVSGYPPFPLLAPVQNIVFVSFVIFCEIWFPDLPLRLYVRFSVLQTRLFSAAVASLC